MPGQGQTLEVPTFADAVVSWPATTGGSYGPDGSVAEDRSLVLQRRFADMGS